MTTMPDTKNTETATWETIKKLTVELNAQTDADIIRQLESQSSIEGYIKRIIREDIAKHSQPRVPDISPNVINDAEKNFDAILNILKRVVSK